MKSNVEEQIVVRDYLLGILSDKTQMRQIEENILLDDTFADMVSAAEEKLIEDYLDKNLSRDHRENFARFFLSTPERKEQFRLTQNVRRYSAKTEAKTDKKIALWLGFKSMFSSPWPAAAGFACLILVSLFVWVVFLRSSDTQMVTQLLNRAFKSERPFEARVSGLDYAPYNITRGGAAPAVNQRELDAADTISANAASRGDTAESLQNAGRIYLVKGEIDQAILQFDSAKERAPTNAEIFNDLGVAYLEKSKSAPKNVKGGSLELKAKALDNFNKARELDPGLLAALFNKAICLQQMDLPGEAKDAWEEYLKLDAASSWAEEARRNLELLSTGSPQSKSANEILQDFLAAYDKKEDDNAYRIVSRNREMISGKLIPQQLAFLFLTVPEAERNRYLAALNYAGQLEKKMSGDPFFLDIARYYSSLSAEKREVLRRAYESLFAGYNRCLKDDYKDALDAFNDAQKMFELAGDIWEAKLCDYWIGYALQREEKAEKSTQLLDELTVFCQSKGYKWLGAQGFSWLSTNMLVTKDFSRALDYGRKALQLSQEVSDLYLTEKVSTQIGEIYRRIGDHSQAITYISTALELSLLPEASLRQKWRDYDTLASMFFALKNYSAAIAYKKESIKIAEVTKEDTFFFKAYTDLGLIYGTQKKYKEAGEAFNKTLDVIAELQDEKLKNRTYAYNLLQMAHIERETGDCGQALKNYEKAVAYYDNSEFTAYAYDGHKGKLLCYYENKDDASFQAELPIILSLFKDYRTKINEEHNRDIFFNNEQNVYDIAIDQEFNKANYNQAFEYSEESRARTLLDLQKVPVKISGDGLVPEITLPPGSVEPLPLEAIQARMPADVQLVQYSVLADKTVIWLITKDDFSAVKTDISAVALHDKTAEYLRLISKSDNSDDDRKAALAKELYLALIAPVAEKLDLNKKICLIPDKILFRLPFSTLISPENGNYFIQQYSFFISPSANMFLICTEKAAELAQKTSESLLSIGNPEFDKADSAALAKLKELPQAEAEATSILQFYEKGVPLIGKDASKKAVVEDLPAADVINFAGHYLVNDEQPLFSGFVLAEDKETGNLNDFLLTNHEIMEGKFLKAKLIVLSACQTGVEGEGMIGSSRAFLAAGVPLVVASQWDVDSRASAELMIRFHRYRKQDGLSTVQALRRSQLDMLEGQNSLYRNPYYWAAFETIGGYAEF